MEFTNSEIRREPDASCSPEGGARQVRIDYADGNIAVSNHIGRLADDASLKVDAIRILVCLKGCMQVDVNAVPCTIRANDVLCTTPVTVLRDIRTDEAWESREIVFSTEVVQRFVVPNADMRNRVLRIMQNPITHIDGAEMRAFLQYYELIFSKVRILADPFRNETVLSLAGASLYELLARMDPEAPVTDEVSLRQGDLLLKRFLSLLSDSPVKKRSVAYYAGRLCVTPKYLTTVCKRVSDKTAYEWIHRFMMEDIAQQLKYSGKSIQEIADDLDFPNISFFGKYVKKYTGLSPTDYRAQLCGSGYKDYKGNKDYK